MIQRLADWFRERRIERLRIALAECSDSDDVVMAWAALAEEISARSPEQVARMEREKGLAR